MDEAAGELGFALERAAELEHAVLLQYLFAAASLKRRPQEGASPLQLERIRDWERTLLLIAREEMAHLAAVSNLLIAVGSAPWLVRPGRPGGRLAGGPGTVAGEALILERFGRSSLARFVSLERAEAGAETVAGHYAVIRREIRRRAAAGDPVVRRTPRDVVGGWGLSGGARLRPVTDAATALELIDAIVDQGAGREPEDAQSHLGRLLGVQAALAEEEEAGFDPARRVVANPGEATPVEDPLTAAVAARFATVYQATMSLLDRYYAGLQAGSRAAMAARRAAQGLMGGVLRPLGEILAELPVGPAAPGWSCGPTFGWDAAIDQEPWPALEAGLDAAGASLRELGRTGGPPRLALVGENLGLAARLVATAAGQESG